MKKVMLLTVFMLAFVVNSFSIKTHVFLKSIPISGCYEVFIVITDDDARGDEWVVAYGSAHVGECVATVGTKDVVVVDSTSALTQYIGNSKVDDYIKNWYAEQGQ